MFKILLFDLETFGFNFNADAGFILCASYKWLDEDKIYTITNDNQEDPQNDKSICKKFSKIIEQADMIVSWNGRNFDVRFLQTRMLKHKLGYLPPVPHDDGLATARRHLKMKRSLENIGNFFGLQERKKKMDLYVWMKAGAGDKTALKTVVKRCESDVRMLQEAYLLLKPLSNVHPYVAVQDKDKDCPLCAKTNCLQKRGRIEAKRHYRIRFHCPKCGGWPTSGPIKK